MVKVLRDRFKYDVFPFLQITSTTQKLEPRKRLCGERFKTETKTLITQLEKGASR